MGYTFKGGYHPPDGKSLSEHCKIEQIPQPDTVAIHLSQHIGAPSKPIVSIGEEVKVGQPLSEAAGFVSIPVHSSVSGKVKAIAKIADSNGVKHDAVIIENDKEDTLFEGVGVKRDYSDFTPDDMRKIIGASGVAGMGGARFPTHVKLSVPKDKKITHVILNGVECEPYLTADDRLMQETPETIVEGLLIMMKICNAENGIIGIELNKPKAIETMEKAVANIPNVKIIGCKVKYPQGGEKQLIVAALGKEVPSGGLPMDVGAVVSNVGTAHCIYEAIALGKPLYERVVTVTGEGVNSPKNILAKIGTPVKNLVDYAGGLKEDIHKVINGGPMMGASMSDLLSPVHKGTSGVLCITKADGELLEEQPCLSCGKCVTVCPMRLVPCSMATLVEFGKYEEAQKLGIMDCISCGTCAYVCPSKRNLVHYFIRGKGEVMKMKTTR
ncbi:MAG: electron transport complex subunit RsxC [Candidatus Cloacimonadota bacterium]|nr:MAG: electron transport complex subunit RsxC [Candidatus Cloacimonadota bacterium]PIE80648.1 MAG: electron transport complex subunit RsxC [Candidatus Delongbacteria bacterium]